MSPSKIDAMRKSLDNVVSTMENFPDRITRRTKALEAGNISSGSVAPPTHNATKIPNPKGKPGAKSTKAQMSSTPKPGDSSITGLSINELHSIISSAMNPVLESIEKLTTSINEIRGTLDSHGEAIEENQGVIKANRDFIKTNHANIDVCHNEIKEHTEDIRELYSNQSDISEELDDVRQASLDKGLILSGPLIHGFVLDSENKELLKVARHAGHPIVEKLTNTIFAAGAPPPAQPPMVAELPNGHDGEHFATDAALHNSDGQTITPNEDSASGKPDIKIESVNKISSHKKASNAILIKMASRDDVHKVFKLAKASTATVCNRFYAAEQLTKQRQDILYKIRMESKNRPELHLSTFTRNGTPMVKLGEDTPVPVKTPRQLSMLLRRLQAR